MRRYIKRLIYKIVQIIFENEYRQIEALISITSGEHFPKTRRWAMSPDAILRILREIHIKQPCQILELGSGASTEIIARHTNADILSLEQSADIAKKTRQLSETYVLHCPIVNGQYDFPEHPKGFFDFVIIDGPKNNRSGLDYIFFYISDSATIIFDDAYRYRKEIRQYGNKYSREIKWINTENGLAILESKSYIPDY